MASDKIKGLTVKIGADTSDFVKELKKVDKEINATNKQATELQKGLQLEFDEGRFIEAQRLVQKSLEETEEKAKAIKQQLKFLEDSGAVDTDGYKRLQTELYKTENSAVLLKQKLEDINNVKTVGITTKIKNLVTNLKASTVATGAVVAGLTQIATKSAKAGGEIQDMADRLGVTAEQIQRYDYIAMQSGVSTEELVKSIAKARDAIASGIVGTNNTATTALKELFGDLSQIPANTEAGFNAIIDQLSKVEDSTLQAYYANEIFGERLATNLIPLINNGADKIAKLNNEFESLGALTNDEVQELADFDDRMNEMQKKVQNLTYELGLVLVPILEMVFKILEPFIPLLQTILDLIEPIIEGLSKIGEFTLMPGLTLLGKGWLWGKADKKATNNVETAYNENSFNYTTPTMNSNSQTNNYEDNSVTNVEINADLSGNLEYDSRALAEEVIKQLAVKKQSSGR